MRGWRLRRRPYINSRQRLPRTRPAWRRASSTCVCAVSVLSVCVSRASSHPSCLAHLVSRVSSRASRPVSAPSVLASLCASYSQLQQSALLDGGLPATAATTTTSIITMSPAGTVLVTGANGGLGSAIVSHILKTPDLASRYTGLYAVRKAATASNLQAALKGAPPKHNYETLDVDLGSLASVKAVARDVNERVARRQLPPIRALILNAGYHEGTMLVSGGMPSAPPRPARHA